MDRVERIFRQAGAVLEGHFLLTSGRHSPVYWEKMRVLQQPRLTTRLCRPITHHFRNQGVEVVVGPTMGGVPLAFEVARQLGVRSAYADREGDGRIIRGGQLLAPGEKVLIIDDILTTGGSLRHMVDAVDRVGAKVVGIAVIVDRRPGGDTQFTVGDTPVFASHRSPAPSYPPEECPLCKTAVPLEKLGGKR
ncbi:MAG: orotate phosphoribosyltransferase [Dehalococcoidia bacterium]|jgi:orotate phosphoribosyltransferase|nr:orotate phosphoribosyltransferase [Dehalococcoidia bacterium]MDP6782913.1 orotate phosphoribosyltransferase [Dehalococcoidia bacterium]